MSAFDRGWTLLVASAAAFAALLDAGSAQADPQASVGFTAGAALNDIVGPRSLDANVHLGLRGDLLLLRSQPNQMAIGPYLDVATSWFHNLDLGGGASWFIPASEDISLVLGAGGFVRDGSQRSWAPGVEGTLFLGSRSYNFHSAYSMANGLFAQTRWVPESPSELDVVVGLQVDLELFALPVLFILNAGRH